jgi:hypothetical protein
MMPLRSMKVLSSSSCSWAAAEIAPAAGCSSFARRHASTGVGAVELARELPELVLRRLELAQRDIEQAVGVDRDALVERQLALELLLAKAERRSGLWRHLFFEILDVARDGVRGLGRGIGEVAEQVHVVEGRKRAAADPFR